MEWKKTETLVGYEEALAFMDGRVAAIHAGEALDCVWMLEHPPLYTGGTSAKVQDLLSQEFPVYETGRGGEYTYHGPGQRVGYVMMDLKARQGRPDIKKYVCDLEEWIIQMLAVFGIEGQRREGRIGIWCDVDGQEKKIAALGVRVRHWITLHGIAINVDPDLSHFGGIVPCGISDYGVTSMREVLGREVDMGAVDVALRESFKIVFDR